MPTRSCFTLIASLILLASISVMSGQSGQTSKPIPLGMALGQPNSPIAITSTTSTSEYLFEQVRGKNNSDQTVTAVTFGIAVIPIGADEGKRKPFVVSGKSIPTSLKPGEERTLAAYLVPAMRMVERLDIATLSELETEVGVVAVEYANGTTWNYVPDEGGGFRPRMVKLPPR